MQRKIHVALIYGSARPGRFCDVVAGWAEAEIRRHGQFTVDVIDPLDFELSAGAVRGPLPGLSARIARADAVVVVTPEYNHSYPAVLKALIDSLNEEWYAKPVAFVSYGGQSGGLRAVEQLRLVFAELHAVTIRDTVSFANAWERFDADGRPQDSERASRSMSAMLASLVWWAGALRHARQLVPYDQRAA